MAGRCRPRPGSRRCRCCRRPSHRTAQRAKKKGRVRTIHAKIANTRKDAMHKFSTGLVERNAAIFVGNVQAGAIVKSKMAKSTLDAGYGQC